MSSVAGISTSFGPPARSARRARAGGERAEAGGLPPGLAALCAVIAALPGTVGGLRTTPDLLGRGLVDPDSAMRLVRLHDIIAAGRPLAAVMRDGSGAGSVMSWSHLLDSLLLLLAAPFATVLGWDVSLHLVGLAFGPLGLAALGVAVAWAAWPVARSGWVWVGAAAAGSAPLIRGYGTLGVVHHHGLLVVVAVVGAGWALRMLRGDGDVRAAGMALGAWTGAGVWLSPEALPFSLMALGAVWVAWLVDPARRAGGGSLAGGSLAGGLLAGGLLAASVTALVVTVAAWLVDPPAAGWLAAEPDRISLPFALMAAGAAVVASMAWLGAPRWGVLTVGAGLGAGWLAVFPQVLHGTAGLMPAAEAAAFFGGIQEMQPLHGVGDWFAYLVGGVFAAGVLLTLAWGERRRRRGVVLLYAAGCGAVLIGLAAVHVRFATYPEAAGAVMLPIVLSWVSRSGWRPGVQSAARLSMLLPLVLAPIVVGTTRAIAAPGSAEGPGKVCPLDGAAALLAGHAGEVVLAGVNLSPDLLYRAPVLTVGSLYHRNPGGFMRLRAAWRSLPGDAPSAAVLATKATLVLACPGEKRSLLLDGLPKVTLLDAVIAGHPPRWLRRVADAGPGGFVLYRVGR